MNWDILRDKVVEFVQADVATREQRHVYLREWLQRRSFRNVQHAYGAKQGDALAAHLDAYVP